MSVSLIIAYLLVFTRLSGLLMFMPGLSLKMIPNTVKVVMVATISIVLVAAVPEINTPPSMSFILTAMASEYLVGMTMGWLVNLVFAGLSMGTEVISTQIGQAAANQFNPAMSLSQSPIGGICVLLSITVFLGANLHLTMIEILADSFQSAPPGQIINPISGLGIWIDYTPIIFATGIKVSGPILALVLLNNTFLAVLSRLAPNMNVFFSVGFLVSMIGGMVLFTFLLPNIFDLMLQLSNDSLVKMRDFVDAISGR